MSVKKDGKDEQMALINEHRKLIREQRYMVYLKTLKIQNDLRAGGILHESFETFSRRICTDDTDCIISQTYEILNSRDINSMRTARIN